MFFSEEEKNKILEEIEKFFNNQDESFCKEKKIVLSIHVFQSEKPKRVEIQKKPMNDQISFIPKQEQISQEEKTENQSKPLVYETTIENKFENLKEKLSENFTFEEKTQEMSKNEKTEEDISKNEKTEEIPKNEGNKEEVPINNGDMIEETNAVLEKEPVFNGLSDKSLFESTNKEINFNGINGKTSPQNNPFLSSPVSMKFSITDLINSQNNDENNFSFANNNNVNNQNNISSFNNLMEFCKPPEAQGPNIFQSLFNQNIYQQNPQINQSLQINQNPQISQSQQNNFSIFHQNSQDVQNFQSQNYNIFGFGQQPQMDLQPVNVSPVQIDQKAACSLFTNQNNQIGNGGNRQLPRKFRQDQQKLRVNSVFNQ